MCAVTWGGGVHEGRALLESDHVRFRATDVRLKIPFRDVTTCVAERGRLVLTWRDAVSGAGRAEFELGEPEAGRWADRISHPKILADKLGIKPNMRIAVDLPDARIDPDELLKPLRERTDDVTFGGPKEGTDLVFFEADSVAELAALASLRASMKPNGGIWVVSPKGDPSIRDVDVIQAAKDAGLVDVKVVRWSQTHTALKLVIPLALR
jgi:hypothetical protein